MPLHREGIRLLSDSGLSFTFDDRVSSMITARSGFGLPPVDNRTRRAPYQHGASWITFRYNPRIINLPLTMMQCSRTELFALRKSLIDVVNLFGGAMRLQFVAPSGNVYYLNVYYQAGLEWTTVDQPTPVVQRAVLQLIAYDPFWYDWDETEETYSHSFSAASCFYFRTPDDKLVFPFSFGAAAINYTFELTNAGDAPVYPTLTVYGPFDNPRFENTDNSEYILWDNTVPGGSTLVIDCENKTIELDGVSSLGSKTPGSSFLSLDPSEMGVTNGLNHLWVSGTQYCGSTGVLVSYRNKYVAI